MPPSTGRGADDKDRAAIVTIDRRNLLKLGGGAVLLPLAGCDSDTKWHEENVSGSLPPLSFNMTDAMNGKPVTAADFRGKVVLLYFGYTLCPDFCPTTLTNLATVLQNLGKQADQVRVLFVTVDPNRDTLPVLKRYAGAVRAAGGRAARHAGPVGIAGAAVSRGLFGDARA